MTDHSKELSMITIEIRKRLDDYHAQIKGMPENWGCGESSFHAIGNLVRAHACYFFTDHQIEEIKKLSDYWAGIEAVNSYRFKIDDATGEL